MTPTADEWSVIVGMLPLIRHIAWRLRGHIGRVVDIEDLVQVGILGAVRGLATHDPALSDLVPHLARSAEGWMRYEAKVNRGRAGWCSWVGGILWGFIDERGRAVVTHREKRTRAAYAAAMASIRGPG